MGSSGSDGAYETQPPTGAGLLNGHAASDRTVWHAQPAGLVASVLETGPNGLTDTEAARRLVQYGANRLREERPPSDLYLVLSQLRSPLVYILFVAAAVTLFVGEYIDTGVIAVVLVINTIIGFVQERQAHRSVLALQRLLTPVATVVRDGREQQLDSQELVPGDLVLLESGQHVPADLRLAEAAALMVDESLLTGESEPVPKFTEALPPDAVLADRDNMAFTGTTVVRGRARGYVVATGAATEVGEIAVSIRDAGAGATPLQRDVGRLSRTLGIIVGIVAAASFFIGTIQGESVEEMFLVSVALAVSAVPEGLPVAFTVTLALGVRRMVKRGVIVRQLTAVEALGSTTTIGTDKTGTLTENQLTVQTIWAGGRTYPVAEALDLHGVEDESGTAALRLTLLAGTLSNEASIEKHGGEFVTRGDPTEIALLVAAETFGIAVDDTRANYPAAFELPFEPERQFAASVRKRPDDGAYLTFIKGAPERVVEMCDALATPDGTSPLNRELIATAVADLAARGLRVLAMAYRVDRELRTDLEAPRELTFLGLQGMIDPPRAGVAEAIDGCHRAGIRVLMITGDHASTAAAIGGQIGIDGDERKVVTGKMLDGADAATLGELAGGTSIFARVAPVDKLHIVDALKARGEVVAVTGDGVNDAPALRSAHIGVAMGKAGTDVAREAADMVLVDDNFSSIFAAVEEGRVTFDNLRKVTFFLIATNVAEIFAVMTALILGWPLPFLPAQILWLNLVTEGIQHIALAFEPGEPGVIERRPRPVGEGIINRLLWERTLVAGVVMTIGTLLLFRRELNFSGELMMAQTVALTTMVFFEAYQVFNARTSGSVFRVNPFRNPFLFISTAAALALHIAALYLPPTQYVLRVEPLSLNSWIWIIAISSSIVVAMELHKLIRRNPFEPVPEGG